MRSPSLFKGGTVIRCKSESRVSIVAVSQESRVLHVPEKASGDRLRSPGA